MASDDDEVVGHKTFCEGGVYRHEPLTAIEAKAIFDQIEAADERRKKDMPDERSAINAFFDAWQRLKDFGWERAIDCPKDGREFEVIEAGSTGIHRCIYRGDWPDGDWWIMDDGDLWPSRPTLYREINDQACQKPPSSTPE